MRILITSKGEIPEDNALVSRKARNEYQKRRGKSEVIHPPGFWEIITLGRTPKRYTSHPAWKPYHRPKGLRGYDFDGAMPLDFIGFLLRNLGSDQWWRPSTTCHGVHILTKDLPELYCYDDQNREAASALRGYEWFWITKQGHKSFEWQPLKTQMDVIKLIGYQKREHYFNIL